MPKTSKECCKTKGMTRLSEELGDEVLRINKMEVSEALSSLEEEIEEK